MFSQKLIVNNSSRVVLIDIHLRNDEDPLRVAHCQIEIWQVGAVYADR